MSKMFQALLNGLVSYDGLLQESKCFQIYTCQFTRVYHFNLQTDVMPAMLATLISVCPNRKLIIANRIYKAENVRITSVALQVLTYSDTNHGHTSRFSTH